MNIKLEEPLFTKLNSICRQVFEISIEFCKEQNHVSVEIEHLLLNLINQSDTDIQVILRHYKVSQPRLKKELTRVVNKYQRNEEAQPSLSAVILTWLQEAWLISSLQLGHNLIRSGAMLFAIIDNNSLRGGLPKTLPSLFKISPESLRQDLPELLKLSNETLTLETKIPATKVNSETTALNQYTLDLTEKAHLGTLEPMNTRQPEIRKIIDILTCRRQNNVVLIGEPGIGKTTLVEDLSLKIIHNEVPTALQNVSLHRLALETAHITILNDFELILKSIINDIKNRLLPTILVLDDIHDLMDKDEEIAHLFKQILLEGEIHTIVVTTPAGYHRYFASEPALKYRFQTLTLEEPNEDSVLTMLRCRVAHLEQYHQVRITDKALHQAVQLSQRYLLERKLPEKALSVLDTACARVALAQKSTPLLLTGTLEQIVHLQEELRLLQREQLNGDNHSWRLEQLTHELEHLKTLQTKQKERWHQELNLVNQFHQLEQTLENEPFSALPKTEPNFSNPFLPGEMANETPIGPENQKTSFQTETNDPKIVQNAPRFSLPKLKQSEKAKPTKGDEIPLVQPLPKAEKPNQFGPSNFPLSNGAVADPFYSAQLNVENEPNKEENTLLLLDDDDSLLLPGNRSSQETENLSLQIDNLENLSKTSPNPTKREPGKIPAFLRKKRMIAQSESSPQNHLLGESTKVSPVSQPLPKVVKRESVTFHKEKVPNQAEIPALEREEAEMISELKTVAIQKSEFIQSQQLPVDTKEAETILGPKPENAKAPQIQEQVANYKIEPNGLEQESEQTQRTDNDESESNGLEQIQHPDNDKIESNGFEQEPEKTKSLDNDERESKGLEQEPKSEQAKCPNNYVADIPSAYHPQNKTKRLQADLNTVKQKLAKIQGHDPMIPAQVDERIIAAVISDWVNIPVNQMLIDEIHTVLSLKKKMVNRVLGQPRALDILAKQIQTHRANLNNAHKLCAFFLTGPRGVGKTETAITLAEILFASERNLLTLNMEDYQKIEAISTLIGISPSSLSYSKTGTLIEAVQKNPYCVILLEDIEKAHPTFISFLQQILTHGTLKLAQAQRVDFRNTLILLTSHLGSEAIIRLCNAPAITPNLEQVQEAIYPELCQHFQPDFLSRLVIVPYYAFSEIEIRRIVKLKLAQLQQRCREQYKARLTYDDSVINMLVNRCTDVDRGAHHINAILMENLLPSLAVEILERMAYEQGFHAVHLTCNKQSHFNFQFDTTKLLPTENLPIPEDGPNQPSYHQLLDELDEVLDGLKMVNSE